MSKRAAVLCWFFAFVLDPRTPTQDELTAFNDEHDDEDEIADTGRNHPPKKSGAAKGGKTRDSEFEIVPLEVTRVVLKSKRRMMM